MRQQQLPESPEHTVQSRGSDETTGAGWTGLDRLVCVAGLQHRQKEGRFYRGGFAQDILKVRPRC